MDIADGVQRLTDSLPALISVLVAGIVAFVVARIIRDVLRRTLARTGIDDDHDGASRGGREAPEPRNRPSLVIADVAFWSVLLTGVVLGVLRAAPLN
ncbi:MAG: hypothetical protein H6531_06455 [Actinobacteria bacterium]|nr:hypothetical protein [Thermoleophilia bacterium]MCB9011458.1 hypothetical protein [Actinomycetota bacterium]